MNNILSHLLIKLAEKEIGEKELSAKVKSLEILVSAIISTLDDEKLNELARKIESELAKETQRAAEYGCLADELLIRNINSITTLSLRD
ncbi:anti-adapter protein [Brenneria roseae subsp. roseae]|uniref:sigma-S stabilization anti-adapter protein IraP n=1 Tax=Brenneria roseae TaxID=1509241 RepID=UPI000D60DC65|nr:sigma-S stabilization anti-adapter protein IraP [Brenneria roseae]PWC22104.1 anti-adapter protein [Brenneria roseae subsp. roseae]